MPSITFNEETMQYVSIFQDLTRTTVVDCVVGEDRLLVVVKAGDIGRAIGKGGDNIAKVRRRINKEILVVEHSDNPEEFVANVFRNYDVRKVSIEDRGGVVHATVTVDGAKKGKAIGRQGRNLRLARDLIARHHPIKSVSVA